MLTAAPFKITKYRKEIYVQPHTNRKAKLFCSCNMELYSVTSLKRRNNGVLQYE